MIPSEAPNSALAFLKLLVDLQLLSAQTVEQLQRSTAGLDPAMIAGRLVESGQLTRFQADELLAGRGPGLVLRQYVLLDLLGEGGMGRVFKASHRGLDRIDALKVILPARAEDADAVRRFHREARVAARLSHPNLVLVYDAGESDGLHFLAMEYVPGIDLGRLVRRGGPLPVGRACEYVRQAALGLHHAHERGLIHRDVKPGNLLLAGDTVRVVDLGLALPREPGAGEGELTGRNEWMGTPDFIAPEQAGDPHGVDARADVYSLGCTLYFLLAGRVPFAGGTAVEKLLRHRMETPPPLAGLRHDLPAGLAQVVERMMARAPADRYPTAAAVAIALQPFSDPTAALLPSELSAASVTGWAPSGAPGLVTGQTSAHSTQAPAPLATARAPVSRNRRALLAVAGLASLAVAFLVWWFWPCATLTPDGPGDQPSPSPLPELPSRWRCILVRPTHQVAAYGRAFDPTGKYLVLACGDEDKSARAGQVRLWDVEAGKEKILGTTPALAARVAFAPDGKRFAVACGSFRGVISGEIQVWDLNDCRQLFAFDAHQGGVYSLAYSSDGRFLASAGRDGAVRIWPGLSDSPPKPLAVLTGHKMAIYSLAFSPDGETLAGGETPGQLWRWSVSRWEEPARSIGKAQGRPRQSTFHPAGDLLLGSIHPGPRGQGPSAIQFWSLGDRPRPPPILHPSGKGEKPFDALALSGDGRMLAAASLDPVGRGLVKLWNLETRKELGQLLDPEASKGADCAHWARLNAVAIAPDGRLIATAGEDANFKLWTPAEPSP